MNEEETYTWPLSGNHTVENIGRAILRLSVTPNLETFGHRYVIPAGAIQKSDPIKPTHRMKKHLL